MFLLACNEGLVLGTREICLIVLDWQEKSWLKLTTYSCISSCVFNRDLKDTHWACCSWSHDRTLPVLQVNKPLSLQHSQLVYALLIKQLLSHSSNCLQFHNIDSRVKKGFETRVRPQWFVYYFRSVASMHTHTSVRTADGNL